MHRNELLSGNDWQWPRRHSFAQARHEMTVPSDDHERPLIRMPKRDGDARHILQMSELEDPSDQHGIPIKQQREGDVVFGQTAESADEVFVAGARCALARGAFRRRRHLENSVALSSARRAHDAAASPGSGRELREFQTK